MEQDLFMYSIEQTWEEDTVTLFGETSTLRIILRTGCTMKVHGSADRIPIGVGQLNIANLSNI